uniref:Uncharacterized protein n=1 Tax=Rhizophora mucronata TaxID=61149 RepID=A0A2P2NB13_RHIMU
MIKRLAITSVHNCRFHAF